MSYEYAHLPEDSIGYGTVIGGVGAASILIWVCLVPFRDEACGIIMGDMGSRLIALEIFPSYRIRGYFFFYGMVFGVGSFLSTDSCLGRCIPV